jgi:predicted ATPase/Tfp pilus assembly protein PilF
MLKGQGGVGKTRLAMQTAVNYTTDYQDGVAFVSVAGVETESALVPTIVEAINFSLSGAKPPAQQLLQYLQQREILLILDNCETLLAPHLRGCLSLVRDIIQKCPQVKILATSRERFNFQAERMLPVLGLAYDEPVSPAPSQAVQLFVARAQQVWPNFGQTADILVQVGQICELAEGLPLAIELAAAAVAHFPLEHIISSIQGNLDFLGQQGDVPERHSSLRAVFAGAWEQLNTHEQAAFKKVAVFRGPFALDTAVLVTNTTPTTLLSLADKSMLRVTQLGRYEMHQLLRQFAQEKLTAAEAKAIHYQHSHYFANFLQQRRSDLEGERQMEALTEIGRVMEDVRAAWQWGIEQQEETAVGKLLESLFLFYQIRSWPQEGETTFTEALAGFGDGVLSAKLLARRGEMRFRLSKYEEARVDMEAAVPIFLQHEATDEYAIVLTGLGHTFHYLRQRDKAIKLYEESLMLHRQTGNQRGQVRALNSLGAAYRVYGRYEEAQAKLQEGLAIVEQTRDRWMRSMLLNNLGSVSRMLGNYEAAIGYYQESLKLKEEMGDRFGYSTSVGNLGNIYHALARYDEARDCHQEALAICHQTGNQIGVARALNNLGHVAFDLGQYDEAQRWHQQSLELKEAINDQYGMVHSFHHLGRTMMALRELEAAQAYYHQGLQLALEMEAVPLVLDIFVSWAALLGQLERKETAVQLLTFAHQHPSNTKRTGETAAELLAELGVNGTTAVDTPTLEELAQQLLSPNF